MDRSYPYTRRLTRRTRLQKRLAMAATAAVAGCAMVFAAVSFGTSPATGPAEQAAARAAGALGAAVNDPAARGGERRVYPHSIVAGGVSNAKELGRVLREDRVVAAHYAEFELDKIHTKTVDTPRAVHVSYRKGDKIYWTANKVMLAKGETLLSDGTHEARARCANRISDTPRYPVEANGPSADELDTPMSEDDSGGSLENVAFGLPGDAGFGPRGGYLHASGTGEAGGILAGGGNAFGDGASGFAPAGAPRGAYFGPGGAVSRGSAGLVGDDSGPVAGGGLGSGTGEAPSSGASPVSGTPAQGGVGVTPGAQPGAQTGVQPVAPAAPQQPGTGDGTGTPGNGAGNTTPGSGAFDPAPGSGSSGTAPVLPTPVPVPVPVPVPAGPDNGQAGGGQDVDPGVVPTPGAPALPATGIGQPPFSGGNPQKPGGESGLSDPTLTPPLQPALPDREPEAPTEVPEPASIWLVGGALGLMLVQRRRNAKAR